MGEYIEPGYWDGEYVDCGGTPSFIEAGYVIDGYIEGCDNAAPGVLAIFNFHYIFQETKQLKVSLIPYLFAAPKTIQSNNAPYLYDNQISLESIRIVREKIS